MIERTERRTKNRQRQFAVSHFIEAERSTKDRRRSLHVNAAYKCSQYDLHSICLHSVLNHGGRGRFRLANQHTLTSRIVPRTVLYPTSNAVPGTKTIPSSRSANTLKSG